ncbi:hypothetical protein GH714_007884 [Hevea brasiliensis]|uniref:Uncharacterized protein n=1 Tax=Hevea brasiliensis TaxID=3981 RepID=A0A6A6LHQ8_HEVBR|nr:hypothetical protein GH714_007884 [Hevea brasiliensis]
MGSNENIGLNPISSESLLVGDCNSKRANLVKEREANGFEEHPLERRSTRLERLRSRKPEKEELDIAASEDLAKVVLQFLEPFIVCRLGSKDSDQESSHSVSSPDQPSLKGEGLALIELSAIDLLIQACEKTKTIDIEKYGLNALSAIDIILKENPGKHGLGLVMEEVTAISHCVSQLKMDSSLNSYGVVITMGSIIDLQTLLLAVMCHVAINCLSKRSSVPVIADETEQKQGFCFVDAGIAFCKFQHLIPTVLVKTQVALIVAIHVLLVEYGLCCVGPEKDNACIGCEMQGSDEGKNEGEKPTERFTESRNKLTEDEGEELELIIDGALDQCFFCLYGLNLKSDSSYEDDLAMHKNTSREDYQTKEQCADVFQYILLYIKASSRSGLVKLHRVLRAIRKHFPQPPEEVLIGNAIDKLLDDLNLCEDKLRKPDLKALSEEMSATDKWPGFVLTKEGEEFVQQNANLFEYDLLHNPLRLRVGNSLEIFMMREDCSHAFYMEKLCEKLGYSYETSLSYYDKAIALSPLAMDPFYRMHASCIKLICFYGKQNLELLKVLSGYYFDLSMKEAAVNVLGKLAADDTKDRSTQEASLERKQ